MAIFARRTGEVWYLAVMCGPQARTIRLPLSFLPKGRYNASLLRDNKEKPDAIVLEERAMRQEDSLNIEMTSGGGFVARFSRD